MLRSGLARFLAVFVAACVLWQGQALAAVVQAPAGNRHAQQPQVPAGSVSRTRATNDSFEAKYRKIRDFLASDRKLRRQIKKSAARFGIDPIHLVGALVGEHTYNVDALDFFQTYFVKAASYLKSAIQFQFEGEAVSAFVKRPQFARCAGIADSYELWDCREEVWQSDFAGKTVGSTRFPNDRFSRVFFQPLYAGQTFGLGQLNPLTALRATDMVAKVAGRKKLNPDNAPEVYATIMAPDTTLDYMAAVLKISIDSYRDLAGVDISGNPGLTATLYNLGDVTDRARALAEKRKADPSAMPEENYYGWLVNDKLGELLPLIR